MALDFCYCYCYSKLANTPIKRMTPFPGRSGEFTSRNDSCPTSKVNSWEDLRVSSGPAWLRQSGNNQTSCVPLAGVRDLAPGRETGRKLNIQASHEELTGLLGGETHKNGKLIQCHCLFSTCSLLSSFCLLLIILQDFRVSVSMFISTSSRLIYLSIHLLICLISRGIYLLSMGGLVWCDLVHYDGSRSIKLNFPEQ